MITGSSYSPAKAFINFARDFFEAMAKEDFQLALSGLDVSSKRWSKKELLSSLNAVIGSERICSPKGLTQSASPELEETESSFILRHRLPVNGKWIQARAVFEFTLKKNSDYFKVSLSGFES